MSKDDADFLKTWVQHDKKIMTYRLMSRERRIHVDEAKQRMQSYYDACRSKGNNDVDRPHATFILIGELKISQAENDKHKGGAEGTEMGVNGQDPTQTQTQADESQASTSSAPASGQSFLSGRMKAKARGRHLPRLGIVLASEMQLENAKSGFSHITSCHVYSLQPGPLKDVALLTGIQHELHTSAKYVDTWTQTGRGRELGVITNDSIKDNYDPTKPLPSLAGPSAPALPKPPEVKDAKNLKTEAPEATAGPAKTETAKPEPKKEDEKASAPKSSAAKKSGRLDWSRAKPKAAATSAAKDETVKKSSSARDKAGDASIVIGDSDDDDEKPTNSSRRAVSSRSKKSRRALLGDDSDDDEKMDSEDDGGSDGGGKIGYDINDDAENDVQVVEQDSIAHRVATAKEQHTATTGMGKRVDAKKKSSKAELDRERQALEDMMDLDDDPDIPATEEPSTAMMRGTANADDAEATPKPKRRVRKQRKVQKKIRRTDKRGYKVTEMVDEYESYSSDESDAPAPAPAGKAKAAPKKPAKPPAAQSASSSASAPPSRAPSTGPVKKETQPSGSTATSGRKPSGGAAPQKGQQSLNSFFTKKPKQ